MKRHNAKADMSTARRSIGKLLEGFGRLQSTTELPIPEIEIT